MSKIPICKTQCTHCSLKEICMPVGFQEEDFNHIGAVLKQNRRVKKGEFLFHAGETFSSLYAVRTGFFKTTVSTQDGRDQVTGFFMSGELVGTDGICLGKYACDAVALEDSEVCELPFDQVDELNGKIPNLYLHFLRLMSREIVRNQTVMLLLGNMRAEERLAMFLLNLSDRLYVRGFAANDFILRMSREEIGSYLGLKLETVSRTLSKFKQDGLIDVEHKHIRILLPRDLQSLVSGCQERREY